MPSTLRAAAPATAAPARGARPRAPRAAAAGRAAAAASAPPARRAASLPAPRRARPAAAAAASAAQDVIEGAAIDDRIPVTVITGFLGAGKTTLLNHVLTGDHGLRIAVIENEFGAIDIDSELVARREALGGEQVVVLNNGCVCCTVRGDLVRLLGELVDANNSAASGAKFDRIVIETTGLARPAPVIQTFFLEPEVAARCALDGVVTLVDAAHAARHLGAPDAEGRPSEAAEQIAYADRIVLNKTDLVPPAELAALEARVRAINALAPLRRASRAAVPLDFVLGVGGFDLARVEEGALAEDGGAAAEGHEHGHEHGRGEDCAPGCTDPTHDHAHEHAHGHSHAHAPAAADDDCAPGCTDPTHDHPHHHAHGHAHAHDGHAHAHDDAVTSVSVEIAGDLDLDKVNYWLGGLLELKGEEIYRCKGVLAVAGFDRRFVFQGVHSMFEGAPDRLWKEGEERRSRMVFIGRDLDAALIRGGFAECAAGVAPPPAGRGFGGAAPAKRAGKK
jgi:G3E family GTPase